MPIVTALLLFSVPTIDSYLQPGLKEAEFTASVVKGDQAALSKIGKDFGRSYEFSSAHVYAKEPFQLRIESKYEGTTVSMIENGNSAVYHVPGIRLKPSDLTHSPGRRQTFLDFGILTPSLFSDLFDATFVSEDATAGTVVFDLAFKASDNYKDTSRQRITVDAAKHYVVKREWFGQDAKLRATFLYTEPKQISGFWLPTDMTVTNADGVLAGETKAKDIKVNGGLDDKLFATR